MGGIAHVRGNLMDALQPDASPDGLKAAGPLAISDETFCRHVERLKRLQDFLYQEAIPISATDASSLGVGDLSGMHFSSRGRPATADEWNRVEKRTQIIYLLLTPALRKKFLMSGTPWMVTWLPVYFLGLAALSLVLAMVAMNGIDWPESATFYVYLLWLISVGALGAFAFIGMNALSIQDDITFDLTNMRLISLRATLGALFAVILTLPFGYPEFLNFCRAVWKPSVFLDNKSGVLTTQAAFLLMPFVLGFSTSLVILILTQLVDAVQAFLGKKPQGTLSALSSSVGNTPIISIVPTPPQQQKPPRN